MPKNQLNMKWTGLLLECKDCGGLVLPADLSEWDGEDASGVAWIVETFTCEECGRWIKERMPA